MDFLATTNTGWIEGWLAGQNAAILWLLTVGGIGVLVFGADWTVESAVRLAGRLGMSKVIIGATIVSLGTTTPEMFTSVTAAFRGESGLSLGNAVGSIICDTGLIFGLGCVLTRLPLNRFVLNRHGWLQFGSGLLLVAICVGLAVASGGIGLAGADNEATWNVIPRWIGLVLVACLIGYLAVSVRWARQRPDAVEETVVEVVEVAAPLVGPIARAGLVVTLITLIVGLAMVAGGSNVLIPAVSELAVRYGVPKDFLAVTLVALGTSLPELVTAIASIVKGHKELLVGNIIGADILNVLFVVGLSSCAAELPVPPTFYLLHLPAMMVVLLLLRAYIFIGRESFRRWQGIPLLAVYVLYLAALVVYAPQTAC